MCVVTLFYKKFQKVCFIQSQFTGLDINKKKFPDIRPNIPNDLVKKRKRLNESILRKCQKKTYSCDLCEESFNARFQTLFFSLL